MTEEFKEVLKKSFDKMPDVFPIDDFYKLIKSWVERDDGVIDEFCTNRSKEAWKYLNDVCDVFDTVKYCVKYEYLEGREHTELAFIGADRQTVYKIKEMSNNWIELVEPFNRRLSMCINIDTVSNIKTETGHGSTFSIIYLKKEQ